MKYISNEALNILKSVGSSVSGKDLIFGDVLLETILLEETRYPLFKRAKKSFHDSKFSAVTNDLILNNFSLKNSTDNTGNIIPNTPATLGGAHKVVPFRPFDETLSLSWFEKVELSGEMTRVTELVRQKLVDEAILIALGSKKTATQAGVFDQFDGWVEQGKTVQTGTTWKEIIDAGIAGLDKKALASREKISIIVPASMENEVYDELVRNNFISEDRYNMEGVAKYRNFALEFDSSLDNYAEVKGIDSNFVVVVYQDAVEILYSGSDTIYKEIDLGSTEQQFFGTYFAPNVRNKDLFIVSKKKTTP